MKKFVFSLLFLLLWLPVVLSAQSPVLSVTGGKIRGVPSETPEVTIYKGIPYAAPPVGVLRWKRPQPVRPWKGVRNADQFGNIAWQGGQQPGTFYWKEFYQNDHSTMSEDCLYLNVWAPTAALGKTGGRLPVVMWVHGGAYMNGYGNEITMDGVAWAKRGVILVTINYRLGLLGFLCHPALSAENGEGISGNYGTFDQVAALQWVHDNIAQFGGDPDNITVMGQSAGAASVKNLVISPLSRGLIRHAIIQSGGGIGKFIDDERTPTEADAIGKELMDKAGLTTLEQMRTARPEDILKITAWGNAQPHTDGYLLTESFDKAVLDGSAADIDYMIGATLDDIASMNKQIDAFCYVRDSISTHPVYQYLFARKLPGSKDGAFHSSELWYMFGTLRRSWRPFTPEDETLSMRMLDYWANFAKYGNPNGNPRTGQKEKWHAFTWQNPYVEVLNVR